MMFAADIMQKLKDEQQTKKDRDQICIEESCPVVCGGNIVCKHSARL